MKRIVVAGEINADLIFADCGTLPQLGRETLARSFRQVPGSSSMICAMGLARLANPVSFIGRCGDDHWADGCIDSLREAGVDTSAIARDAGLQTGLTVAISSRSDRALLTFLGAIAELSAADITDAALANAGHLHVSSYYLQNKLRSQVGAVFARARAAGLTTSLDPGSDPEQRWEGDLLDLLRQVDVFLPNQAEAYAISDTNTPESALRALDNGVTQTVIKLGSRGAMSMQAGQLVIAQAYPTHVVDTTGAGDSFNAGFLHAWLRGHPLGVALQWGNACGGLSTRGIGGTAMQGNVDEVLATLGATS